MAASYQREDGVRPNGASLRLWLRVALVLITGAVVMNAVWTDAEPPLKFERDLHEFLQEKNAIQRDATAPQIHNSEKQAPLDGGACGQAAAPAEIAAVRQPTVIENEAKAEAEDRERNDDSVHTAESVLAETESLQERLLDHDPPAVNGFDGVEEEAEPVEEDAYSETSAQPDADGEDDDGATATAADSEPDRDDTPDEEAAADGDPESDEEAVEDHQQVSDSQIE